MLKHSRDFNLTRESVLGSKLAPETPAYDIQQACDTGIQAAIAVANKIALGQIEVGIAGGTDTTSDAPIAVNEKLRKILLEANRAKSMQGRLAALAKVRPGVGGEIQLTDAMDALIRREGFAGYVFSEGRYDIGQKLDFLRATVELALDHPELGADFRLFLADLAKRRLLD